MADRINWNDINEKFPIAGKDNDSQVFRNNFTIIKENWKLTRDLLSAIETNAVVLNGPNDFKGNELLNAVLAQYNKKIDTSRINGVIGDVLGDIYVTPEDGAVQVIRALRNLKIHFQGWADELYYQEIRLLLLTDGGPRRVDFLNDNGAIYSNNPDKDEQGNSLNYAIPNDVARSVIVDVFTYDGGNTVQCYIYTDYSGFLDDGTVIPSDGGNTTLEDIKDILPLPGFYEPEGNRDSLTGGTGTPFWAGGDSTQPTDIILITPPGDIDNYYAGQKLRIWGASSFDPTDSEQDVDITNFAIRSVAYAEGVEEADWGTPDQLDYVKYKLHYIDFGIGRVSEPVEYAQAGDGINVNFANFSNSNFINIIFDRPDITKGVLVYRSVNDGDYRLIDILGPKQLGSLETGLAYQDYGPFSFVDHSRKGGIIIEAGIVTNPATANAYIERTDNSEGTGLDLDIVFSNSTSDYGFVDAIVKEVNKSDPNVPYIVLTETYYMDSTVRIASDDTQKLQEEIDSRIEKGINYLRLNDRTYNVSQLTIPNNFMLVGTGNRTELRKISFATDSTLAILNLSENATNVTLKDFKIDGNQQNQYLRADTELYENYTIYVPSSTEAINGSEQGPLNINVHNVAMQNILGGGLYSPYVENYRLDNNRFENQGMDDIWGFSPLVASSSRNLIIDSNIFVNFTDSIDVMTSDTGAITGNVIKSCGSGLTVFGSKFLTTSPNTIVGPNNEFIWGPDVYNSEFDLINIFLTRDSTFVSDVYKYQENGINVNLTVDEDAGRLIANIIPKLYPLRKSVEGVELLGAEILIDKQYNVVISGISTGIVANDVLIQEQTTGSAWGTVLEVTEDTNTTLTIKMYKGIFNTTDLLLVDSTSTGVTATSVTYITGTDIIPIALNIDSELDPSAGEFRWKIQNDISDPFSSVVNRILDDYSVTELKKTNADSIGLVYQVIFEEFTKTDTVGISIENFELINTPTNNRILVTPSTQWSVSIGDKVRSKGLTTAIIGTQTLDNYTGTVASINTVLPGSPPQIIIEYEGTITGIGVGSPISVAGSYFATKNSFVLAKGRVQ